MQPHTRAMIAAAAFAIVTRNKVAGVYDHSAARDRRIAAEFRDNQVQGVDGDRGVKFGGSLPELFDAGDKAFVSVEVEGSTAKGYDRASSAFYTAEVSGDVVQLYDHRDNAWFAYDIQDARLASGYYRSPEVGAQS